MHKQDEDTGNKSCYTKIKILVNLSYYATNVKITEAAAEKVNINTIGQGDDEFDQIWHEERRQLIISSNFGQITKRKQTTKVNATAIVFQIQRKQSH